MGNTGSPFGDNEFNMDIREYLGDFVNETKSEDKPEVEPEEQVEEPIESDDLMVSEIYSSINKEKMPEREKLTLSDVESIRLRKRTIKFRRRVVRIGLVSLLVIAIILSAVQSQVSKAREFRASYVSTLAGYKPIIAGIDGVGITRAKNEETVMIPFPGVIQDVMVSEGALVSDGDPIYILDSEYARQLLEDANNYERDCQDTYDLALDGVKSATQILDGYKAEVTKAREALKAVNDSIKDAEKQKKDAESAVEKAESDLEIIKEKKSDLDIKASWQGTIVDMHNIKVGDVVTEGDTVATLVDSNRYRLVLVYDSKYRSNISTGQVIDVIVQGITRSLQGTIVNISNITRDGKNLLEVVIVVDGVRGVREGLVATAAFTVEERVTVRKEAVNARTDIYSRDYAVQDNNTEYEIEPEEMWSIEQQQATDIAEESETADEVEVEGGELELPSGFLEPDDGDSENEDDENNVDNGDSGDSGDTEGVSYIETTEIREVDVEPYDGPGRLEYYRSNEIKAKASGTVYQINVGNGSTVNSGQVIIRLDEDILLQEIEVAEKDIETKKDSVVSAEQLILERQSGIEPAELAIVEAQKVVDENSTIVTDAQRVADETKSLLEESQRRVEAAKRDLESCNAKALISGNITGLDIQIGNDVDAQIPAMNISDKSILILHGIINEYSKERLKVGDSIEVLQWGKSKTGVVDSIDDTLSDINGFTGYKIDILIDNTDGEFEINTDTQYRLQIKKIDSSLVVPLGAVKYVQVSNGVLSVPVVYVGGEKPSNVLKGVIQSTATEVPKGFYPVQVETGLMDNENIEILSGLQEGQEVFIGMQSDVIW